MGKKMPGIPSQYKIVRKPNAPKVARHLQNLIDTYIDMLENPHGAQPAIYIPQHIKDYVTKHYIVVRVKTSPPPSKLIPKLPLPRPPSREGPYAKPPRRQMPRLPLQPTEPKKTKPMPELKDKVKMEITLKKLKDNKKKIAGHKNK